MDNIKEIINKLPDPNCFCGDYIDYSIIPEGLTEGPVDVGSSEIPLTSPCYHVITFRKVKWRQGYKNWYSWEQGL